MNTVEKGNKLEDEFYQYLLDQKSRGDLVFGAYSPGLCEIFQKKRYYCAERKGDVTFDVVIELRRLGSNSPHLYVIFECKNHGSAIQERDITDFSDKLGRMFRHGAKGVLVGSTCLQSGAENVAKSRKMGIIKYDDRGLEIIADRKGGTCVENRFVKSQFFRDKRPVKSLKFAAYHDGKFFSSFDQFLGSFDPSQPIYSKCVNDDVGISIPYVPVKQIRNTAENILEKIDYRTGPVELENICSMLNVELHFTDQKVLDPENEHILGSANFDRNLIQINFHESEKRKRFTIAHEIGHFCLKHDRYLRAETIVERDLLIDRETEVFFNYERLEFQANTFASDLLLPTLFFEIKTNEYRKLLDIRDRGHGHIFVDDQPCNYGPYNQLLSDLSIYFEVSKKAIEVKLKKMGMLTDQRNKLDSLSFTPFIAN